jgi:hypothetical protein
VALNNVPLTGQTLGVTRVPINQNFSVIDTAFQVDHVDYNIAGQGQHNKVSFPTQNPVPAPQAGIVQLYSVISVITGQPELVFTHQAGSTAPIGAQIVEFTSAGWTNPGWTRLPSGIMFKWASQIGFGGNASKTINLNTDVPGSPNFNALLTVLITPIDLNAAYTNNIGITTTAFPNFTVGKWGAGPNPGASVRFAYLAIGY